MSIASSETSDEVEDVYEDEDEDEVDDKTCWENMMEKPAWNNMVKKLTVALFILGLLKTGILYVVDIGTDIYLAVRYFLDGDTWWGALTTIFLVVPWIILLVSGLRNGSKRLFIFGIFAKCTCCFFCTLCYQTVRFELWP